LHQGREALGISGYSNGSKSSLQTFGYPQCWLFPCVPTPLNLTNADCILTETSIVMKNISQQASQYKIQLIAHKVVSSS